MQRLEADAGAPVSRVLLRRPAAADQDRSRRGLLQGQAARRRSRRGGAAAAPRALSRAPATASSRPAAALRRAPRRRRPRFPRNRAMRSQSIAPAEVSSAEAARPLLDRVQLDPDRQSGAVRLGGAREHGRREERVRLALERTEEAPGHRVREIRRDAAEIGGREQLHLEARRAFDRRLPLHRSEVRLGVGGEQAAGQLDLEIDAELAGSSRHRSTAVDEKRDRGGRPASAPTARPRPRTARTGSGRGSPPRCARRPPSSGCHARSAARRPRPARARMRRRSPSARRRPRACRSAAWPG